MRQLTFRGFTKRYVQQLSLTGTTAVYALTNEAAGANLRMREPLFLYAVTNQCLHTLLAASKNTGLYADYKRLSDQFTEQDLVRALESESPDLSEPYHKVWRSYDSVKKMQERDIRVKKLMAKKVSDLQAVTGVSTYQICRDLGLNNSNVNTWLKHTDARAISLDNARRVLQYVQTFAN